MKRTRIETRINEKDYVAITEYCRNNDVALSALLRNIVCDWMKENTILPVEQRLITVKTPVLPKPALNVTMKHCRKCSESIPFEEYNDFGGYCEQHGKKAI